MKKDIDVLRSLRSIVEKSKVKSKHFDGKCIKINVFDYTELAIINDELTFLDDKGFQYSIWNGDCTLEDFIDILNANDMEKEIFGNNGSIDEQVDFQEKIQKIGLNLVCCCTCDAVFFHRTGTEFVDTLICPFCKAKSDPSDFSDCYYNGMYEHRMELDNE